MSDEEDVDDDDETTCSSLLNKFSCLLKDNKKTKEAKRKVKH